MKLNSGVSARRRSAAVGKQIENAQGKKNDHGQDCYPEDMVDPRVGAEPILQGHCPHGIQGEASEVGGKIEQLIHQSKRTGMGQIQSRSIPILSRERQRATADASFGES
jgi:hypothetical protein